MNIDMAGIVGDSIVDGPGIRTVYFSQGCPHRCEGYQNPETWDEKVWKPEEWKETDGTFFRTLDKYLSDPDVQGLTLTGGDPLYPPNRTDILNILKHVHQKHPKKDVWMWTGYVYEEIQKECAEILRYVDVLVDGPYLAAVRADDIENGEDPQWRGSSNQRILRLNDIRKKS